MATASSSSTLLPQGPQGYESFPIAEGGRSSPSSSSTPCLGAFYGGGWCALAIRVTQAIFAVISFSVMLGACHMSSVDEYTLDPSLNNEGACYSSEAALIFVSVVGIVVFLYSVIIAGLEIAARVATTEQARDILRDKLKRNANTGLLVDSVLSLFVLAAACSSSGRASLRFYLDHPCYDRFSSVYDCLRPCHELGQFCTSVDASIAFTWMLFAATSIGPVAAAVAMTNMGDTIPRIQ